MSEAIYVRGLTKSCGGKTVRLLAVRFFRRE